MAVEQYTKVTHQSWGKNIFNSLIGAILGVALFFGSFFVLWTNEGRTNWAKVAASSTAVDPASVNPSTEGKFIAATGSLVSAEQLGDAPYLQPGSYLKLDRNVEMFAWQESEHSETTKELGGSSTTKTTYEYSKGWTSSPQDSQRFEVPQNHTNPPQRVKSDSWTVGQATVGAYNLNAAELEMPSTSEVRLNSEILDSQSANKLSGGYIFIGRGTLENPQLGDLRIQYASVPNNIRATVFGLQQGNAIVPYQYRNEGTFFRALAGDRATAIGELQTEHTLWTWILRLVGFLMMWIGMSLALGPITAVMNVLPMLGDASGCAIGAATFGAALALSVITVIISIIAHSIIALLLILAVIIGGAVLASKYAKPKAPAAA